MPAIGKEQLRQNDKNASKVRDTFEELAKSERVGQSIAGNAPTIEQGRREEIERIFSGLREVAGAPKAETKDAAHSSAAKLTEAKDLDLLAAGQAREAEDAARQADALGTVITEVAGRIRDQQAQVSSTAANPEAQRRAGERAADQGAKLAVLAGHVDNALQSRYQEMRNQQSVEQSNVARALATGDGLAGVLKDQEMRIADQVSADARLAEHIRKAADSILHRLASGQSAALRGALGAPGADLDTDSLQRIYDKGRTAAGRTLQHLTSVLQGALAEEINDRIQTAKVLAEGDPTATYIAGHRITDANGRGLTDGITAIATSGSHFKISEAYEVKSGRSSARGLTYSLDRDLSPESERVARDAAVAALADEQRLAKLDVSDEAERAATLKESAQRRNSVDPSEVIAMNSEDVALVRGLDAELDKRVERELATLRQASVQREPGQVKATVERLDQQRVFVDGVELKRREEDRQRLTKVHAVVPSGISTSAVGEQLPYTQESIRRGADAAAKLMGMWHDQK